jgi:hypothetical protein
MCKWDAHESQSPSLPCHILISCIGMPSSCRHGSGCSIKNCQFRHADNKPRRPHADGHGRRLSTGSSAGRDSRGSGKADGKPKGDFDSKSANYGQGLTSKASGAYKTPKGSSTKPSNAIQVTTVAALPSAVGRNTRVTVEKECKIGDGILSEWSILKHCQAPTRQLLAHAQNQYLRDLTASTKAQDRLTTSKKAVDDFTTKAEQEKAVAIAQTEALTKQFLAQVVNIARATQGLIGQECFMDLVKGWVTSVDAPCDLQVLEAMCFPPTVVHTIQPSSDILLDPLYGFDTLSAPSDSFMQQPMPEALTLLRQFGFNRVPTDTATGTLFQAAAAAAAHISLDAAKALLDWDETMTMQRVNRQFIQIMSTKPALKRFFNPCMMENNGPHNREAILLQLLTHQCLIVLSSKGDINVWYAGPHSIRTPSLLLQHTADAPLITELTADGTINSSTTVVSEITPGAFAPVHHHGVVGQPKEAVYVQFQRFSAASDPEAATQRTAKRFQARAAAKATSMVLAQAEEDKRLLDVAEKSRAVAAKLAAAKAQARARAAQEQADRDKATARAQIDDAKRQGDKRQRDMEASLGAMDAPVTITVEESALFLQEARTKIAKQREGDDAKQRLLITKQQEAGAAKQRALQPQLHTTLVDLSNDSDDADDDASQAKLEHIVDTEANEILRQQVTALLSSAASSGKIAILSGDAFVEGTAAPSFLSPPADDVD